jgi:hypothetical protein
MEYSYDVQQNKDNNYYTGFDKCSRAGAHKNNQKDCSLQGTRVRGKE